MNLSLPDQTVPSVHALPYGSGPAELFSRLRHLPHPVLLTSGDNLSLSGRFDIITAAPAYTVETRGRTTTVSTPEGEEYRSSDNPVSVLKDVFGNAFAGVSETLLTDSALPFPGGAIGYFSYDLLHPWHRIEPVDVQDIDLPAMRAGIYTWAVIIDHRERQTLFVALPSCPQPLRLEVLSLLSSPAPAEHGAFSLETPFVSNFTKDEYLQAFSRVIDYIHAGDCYQVNLAQRFSAPCSGDPFAAFTHLHGLANAPFSAYLEQGDEAVLSFSPERFIQVNALDVITQPIKGTRPRHADPQQDLALLQELLTSRKDQAENLMIVDLLRNDLGRVCSTGSVHVPALFEAQSFNNVHHLVSTIAGRLESPEEVFDLFAACFPGGSITGAPKIRAMEIINELETRPRSVYCGAIAWFSANGNMDSNICIRTLVCSKGSIHCWGGGGVVADSQGEQEYQETFDKISLFLNNLPVKA